MGLLRLYLALCVVAAHSESVFPWLIHDGRQAVQLFFVISGFYMQFVLATSYDSVRQFYTSRFLRIFIPYYFVLALVMVVSILSGVVSGDWLTLQAIADSGGNDLRLGQVLTAITNLTVFFQDWVMFLQHEPGQGLEITSNFWRGSDPLWHWLVIPQAWSIGLELTFYLIAPILALRWRTRWLVALIVILLVARLLAYQHLGKPNDPWTYRFFPFELVLFCYGILGGRIYLRYPGFFAAISGAMTRMAPKRAAYAALCLVLLLLLAAHSELLAYARNVVGSRIAMGSELMLLASYPMWLFVVPVLFALTRDVAFDRYIGEFSYPVCLIHYTVILALAPVLASLGVSANFSGESAAFVSVGISALLMWRVVGPFERWRQAKVASMAAARTPGVIPAAS